MADGSRWISNQRSREVVQQLRGRVDAIVVGSGTVLADDPLLVARPKSPADVKRKAVRVVVDSKASLPLKSQLVKTARDVPVLVAISEDAPQDAVNRLADAGIQVFRCEGSTHAERLESLLDELGRRRMTNVLVEGGSRLLDVSERTRDGVSQPAADERSGEKDDGGDGREQKPEAGHAGCDRRIRVADANRPTDLPARHDRNCDIEELRVERL